jgi:hypothetical protein
LLVHAQWGGSHAWDPVMHRMQQTRTRFRPNWRTKQFPGGSVRNPAPLLPHMKANPSQPTSSGRAAHRCGSQALARYGRNAEVFVIHQREYGAGDELFWDLQKEWAIVCHVSLVFQHVRQGAQHLSGHAPAAEVTRICVATVRSVSFVLGGSVSTFISLRKTKLNPLSHRQRTTCQEPLEPA